MKWKVELLEEPKPADGIDVVIDRVLVATSSWFKARETAVSQCGAAWPSDPLSRRIRAALVTEERGKTPRAKRKKR